MKKIILQSVFQITGIGAASGLIYKAPDLFIIGDNSGYLYQYTINTNTLQRHAMIKNATENTPKKEKPDFEAITSCNQKIYVFGSGSTSKRNKMLEFDLDKKESLSHDLSSLYTAMQDFANIKANEFNLEGAICSDKAWWLFNRGNGKWSKNTVFKIQGRDLTANCHMISKDYDLPKINGVRSSFTDAIAIENKIYFLAAAENTESTYEDGAVSGSLIGVIDSQKMTLDFTQKISDTQKFEGLTLYENSEKNIVFLLCEDKDTESLETTIYKLTLDKKEIAEQALD